MRLFLYNSLRKGAGCLQTSTGSVTVMWQMMTLWRELETWIKSAGFHGSIVAGKDELVKGLVKTKMLTGRAH